MSVLLEGLGNLSSCLMKDLIASFLNIVKFDGRHLLLSDQSSHLRHLSLMISLLGLHGIHKYLDGDILFDYLLDFALQSVLQAAYFAHDVF
jgi:hypothetical protein